MEERRGAEATLLTATLSTLFEFCYEGKQRDGATAEGGCVGKSSDIILLAIDDG